MISYREQRAIAEFSNRMSRVAMGAAATLDLDSGKVQGKVGSFLIGEELLPKLQFIREGHFSERGGAPTLRVIGDVELANSSTRIVRSNITSDAALRNFLKGEIVKEPLQYLLFSAHSTREWIPIWFYLHSADVSVEEAVEHLRCEPASQPTHRDRTIARLTSNRSAYNVNTGKPKLLVKAFAVGAIEEPTTDSDAHKFALAVQGLPEDQIGPDAFLRTLLKCYERATSPTSAHNNLKSAVFRAACRLDELLYRKALAP